MFLDIITKTNNTLKTYFSAGIAMTNTSLSSLEYTTWMSFLSNTSVELKVTDNKNELH